MSEHVDILEVPTGISHAEAEIIESVWLAKTGRRCVVLSGGHYAGSVEAQKVPSE